MTSAEDFHASRRMFVILNDGPILAGRDSTEGHKEWFLRMGWLSAADDPAFETLIRGYSDGRDIYAYRGRDFLGDKAVEDAMRRHARLLQTEFGLKDSARVFLGVVPQKIGQKWSPHRSLGRISEISTSFPRP